MYALVSLPFHVHVDLHAYSCSRQCSLFLPYQVLRMWFLYLACSTFFALRLGQMAKVVLVMWSELDVGSPRLISMRGVFLRQLCHHRLLRRDAERQIQEVQAAALCCN
jgi:hypothetical protein